MTSEMQERIARAIHLCWRGLLMWDELPERVRNQLRADALAVMKAMREPTPVMIEAGWDARGEVDARYTAMLDAEIAAAGELSHG